MITCKPYGTTFLRPYTCIHKQTELAEILKKMEIVGKRKTMAGTAEILTNIPPVRYFALKKCHNCSTGLSIYKKHLKGELSMDVQTKTCSCGAVITRKEGHNDRSWARVKYCSEHAGMTPYKRNKFFKKQPAPQKVESVPAPKKDRVSCSESPAKIDMDAINEHKKKNGGVCTESPAKIALAASSKKVDPAPVKKTTAKTFRCSVCKKEKELNPDNFHSNTSHAANFDSTCRVCRNEKKRAARGTGAFVVKLDFTNHQELFEKLQEKAEGQLRTIENQALWDMIRALDAV